MIRMQIRDFGELAPMNVSLRFKVFAAIVGIASLAIILSLIPKLVHYRQEQKITHDLNRFIVGLDEDEPGWRLEDLEARRPRFSAEVNSASTVFAASNALPDKWPPNELAAIERRTDSDDGSRIWLEIFPSSKTP